MERRCSRDSRRIETRDQELEARTQELRRRDVIISSIAQRIPELSPAASGETPARPEKAAGTPEETEEANQALGAHEDPEVSPQRRTWLTRFFFGP